MTIQSRQDKDLSAPHFLQWPSAGKERSRIKKQIGSAIFPKNPIPDPTVHHSEHSKPFVLLVSNNPQQVYLAENLPNVN